MKPITQAQIAKKAGLTEGFISQLFTGIRRPGWKNAKKLAQITGTKPELWLEGSPDEIRAAIKKQQH